MIRKYPVFRDDRNNRFVFPGVFSDEERSVNWSQCLMYETFLKVKQEKISLGVDTEFFFPHIRSSAGHPNFAHGSEDVFIIGGPMFDEIWQEENG